MKDFFKIFILGSFLGSIFGIVSCTNHFNLSSLISGNSVVIPTSGGGTSNGTIGTFVLSRVVLNTLNPTNTLDLIGDGSGTLGVLCPITQSTSTSTTSAAPCECSYSYSSSSAPNQQIFSNAIYSEQNLLRCSYTNIPTDASLVNVAIHLKSADSYSNTVSFNFTTTSNAVDLTNPDSYVMPIRYQCRDIVYIPYLFDGSIYDPFQSENIHLTYPINFYASSFATAINVYVSNQETNWNCPPILNPNTYLTGSALAAYNASFHLNLNVYSVTPQPGGGKNIYPPNGAVDRSTFYLSKQVAGIFTVPVNATLAPGTFTSAGSISAPPLGYGATPVPVGAAGSQQETCNTGITIPNGYHWMKLWQFRAGLSQRQYATARTNMALAAITCNPGNWPQASAAANTEIPVFPMCQPKNTNTFSVFNMQNLTSSHSLADRVFSSGPNSGQCIQLDNGSGSLCGTKSPGPACIGGSGKFAGADLWTYEQPFNSSYGCGAYGTSDPFGICTTTNTTAPYPAFIPTTSGLGTASLDTPNSSFPEAAARYDYLFVVTPINVTTADMLSNGSSSISMSYTPYRFYTDEDCYSPDPDLAQPGDCLPRNAIRTYGLRLVDIGSSGDPPATDPNRTGAFPVCVLQPDPF